MSMTSAITRKALQRIKRIIPLIGARVRDRGAYAGPPRRDTTLVLGTWLLTSLVPGDVILRCPRLGRDPVEQTCILILAETKEALLGYRLVSSSPALDADHTRMVHLRAAYAATTG